MAASIGGTEHAGAPDDEPDERSGPRRSPPPPAYSRAVDRGGPAAAGRGCALVVLRAGDGEDLDAAAAPDQRVEQRAPEQLAPARTAGLADDDAGDVVLARVRQDLLGRRSARSA